MPQEAIEVSTHIFFGRYHNVDLGFITAEQAASTLMELDMLIPQWIEQEWPAFMFEAQKEGRLVNTFRYYLTNSINAVVECYVLDEERMASNEIPVNAF